ncbi:hypothetical protein GCM10027569_01360 [Flindersiella endophytica]
MARLALFVSSSSYADGGLAALPSAARDAVELGELFADPQVGPFVVSTLESPSAQEMRLALEDLFVDAAREDVVVLYLSGHGLKDVQGNLYFAAHDTRADRLRSTAVSADLLCSLLNSSRAAGAVVFLDCCYGGAFARGMVARAAGDPDVGEAFAALGGGARARAVITASSAIEYAFEGERLADSHVEPSVFASAMRDGIVGGDADQDGDGWVGLNELFDYIGQRIRRLGKPQTPHLWTFGASGDLRLARSPRGPRASVAALPAEIRDLLTSPISAARLGAVSDLQQRAEGEDLSMARAAISALNQLADDDSLRVRAAASAALDACTPRVDPPRPSVTVGGTQTVRVTMTGPPVALDAFIESPPEGVTISTVGNELVFQASPDATPGQVQLQLRWAGGTVPVQLEVQPPHGSPAPAGKPARAKNRVPAKASRATAPHEPNQPTGKSPAVKPVPDAPTLESELPSTHSQSDLPALLIAAGAVWLMGLFLPITNGGFDGSLTMTGWPAWLVALFIGIGVAAIGAGLVRTLRAALPVFVAAAKVIAVIMLALSLFILIKLAYYTEFPAMGFAAVLNAGSTLVYLLNLAWRANHLHPASRHGDSPDWLIASGGLWILTLLLPTNDYYGSPTPLTHLPGGYQAAVLAAGFAAAGIGIYRRRRTTGQLSLALAASLSLPLIALPFVVPRALIPEDVGFWLAAIAATLSLTCALLYLTDSALQMLHRHQHPTRPAPSGGESK